MHHKILWIYFVFLMLMLTSISWAQGPPVIWTKTYGGPLIEDGYSIDTVSEETFIVGGKTSSFGWGNFDFWLLKIDQQGDTIWAKTYGTSDEEHGFSVIKTEDEGFAVTGQKGLFPFGSQVYTVKTDSMGIEQWSDTYGGDYARSIIQTSDNGYVFLGCSPWEFYLVRTNTNGDTLWTGLYSDGYNNYGYDVYEYINPQDSIFYIMAGCTGAGSSNYSWDVYIVKVNEVGDTVLTRRYGAPEYGPDDWAGSIEPTSDGNFIVAASTKTLGNGGYDFWLMKINDNGDTLWTRTYGGGGDDCALHAIETQDGGFIAVGYTASYGAGGWDVYVVRTNAIGDTIWTKTIGGQSNECAREIISTDKGYIITGYTESFGAGNRDVYLIHIAPDYVGIEDYTDDHIPNVITLHQNYPNPFNAQTTIQYSLSEPSDVTIEIYDLLGRKIETLINGDQSAGNHQIVWNADSHSSGIYFYRLQAGDAVETKRMVLLK